MPIKLKKLKSFKTQAQPSVINVTQPSSIKPLIDRIVFTIQFNKPQEQNEVDEKIKEAGKKLVENDIAQRTGYNSNYQIKLGSKETPCTFSFDPKFQNCGYLRADVNPSKLGPNGMNHFWAFLSSLTDNGHEYIVDHANLSRLDIAFDLYGVDIQNLMIWSETSPTSRAYFRNGRLETSYLGKRGAPKQIKMYDKNAELAAKGLQTLSDDPVTRVEVSLKNPCTYIELYHLDDPFSKVRIAHHEPCPNETSAGLWQMLCSAARDNTLQSVLAGSSPSEKKKLKKHLKAAEPCYWNTEELWGDWQDVIAKAGLL